MSDTNKNNWTKFAKRIRAKIFIGDLFESFNKYLIVLSVTFSLVFIVLKKFSILKFDQVNFYLILAVSFFASLAFILSLVKANKKKLAYADIFAMIDLRLGLNSSLSAASEGIASYPPFQKDCSLKYNFVYPRLFSPSLFAILLIGYSFSYQNLNNMNLIESDKFGLPTDLQKLDNLKEELDNQNIFADEDIEDLKSQMESIVEENKDNLYEHSTLEAANELKEATQDALGSSLSKLNQSLDIVEDLAKNSENATDKIKDLEKLLDGDDKGLDISPQLKEQIKELAKNQIDNPNAQPLTKELRDKIKQLEKKYANQNGNGQNGKDQNGKDENGKGGGSQSQKEKNLEKLNQGNQCKNEGGEGGSCEKSGDGKSEKECQGEDCKKGDTPGVGRGPGHEPLILKEKSAQITSNLAQSLPKNGDENVPGEIVGTFNTDPKSKPKLQINDSSLEVDNSSGGNSVLMQEFSPEEELSLKKYFK